MSLQTIVDTQERYDAPQNKISSGGNWNKTRFLMCARHEVRHQVLLAVKCLHLC